ncbi:MAG: DNA mismatch repair endonuclease MutL [Treponema sp.]|nr:DNA mismatch repair endonuclease MutL [Treponema sp.]
MSIENPVRSLNPEVARKIAAGEVIDRPNAIIRELMDNAIDSGASSIIVEISGGGIEKIRIVDNGCGMTKEDLQNCAHPHATSKISTETDLMNLSTLGFRGEALASIAAVSRLSIISGGWKMRASITEDHILEQCAEINGCIVQSEGLFENFPARRQFLKRAATEGLMCKNTFIEKAMARPDLAFKFISDGETKLDLPAGQSLRDRFAAANSYSENKELFFELSNKSSNIEDGITDWSFNIVIGEPAVSRSNKKDIYIYANGRRIQEYSLVQAVEYGGQGFFPNGTYPVAAVFVKVNPKKIDFNIHPAKKEARFFDISDLHHGLSSTIKAFFHSYTYANFSEDKSADAPREAEFTFELPTENKAEEAQSGRENTGNFLESATDKKEESQASYSKHISYQRPQTGEKYFSDFRSKYMSGKSSSFTKTAGEGRSLSLAEQALALQKNPAAPLVEEKAKVRYIGSCLGTFLLAEKNNCLYCIDQHAVHERILFDKIMSNQGKKQPLLIPYIIKTESKTQDNQLEKLKDRLDDIGFTIEKKEDGLWEVTAIPERWTGTQYDFQMLIFVKQFEPEQIIRSIAAMTACKAAIKDGYVLDEDTAASLVEQAFTLEDPHCPHGRPIYTVISREKLFELVKRT